MDDEADNLLARLRRLDLEQEKMYGDDLTPLQFFGHSTHIRRDEIESERREISQRLAALGVAPPSSSAADGDPPPMKGKNTMWAWGLIALLGALIFVAVLVSAGFG